MRRKIITIDESRCDGCGRCVEACHEGALQLVNGVARLVSDSYCDGLGACLPECPAQALAIVEREAEVFDEEAVKRHLKPKPAEAAEPLGCGCPGIQARAIEKQTAATASRPASAAESQLRQWPCQIKLVPVSASYFDGAHLLVAADCTAYAYADIHLDFMRNRVTLIGCPKLDNADYAEKLAEILKRHQIKSMTVLQMEVPCCGGLANAVRVALASSGQVIPWSVVTIGIDGSIVES